MNSFREQLIRFFSYLRDYKFMNIFILTLYSIGLLWFIFPIRLFEYLLLILIVLIPVFMVHIIEPKNCIPVIDYGNFSSWIKKIILCIKTMCKHYIIKYLTSYCLFLIVFFVAGIFIYCSMFISIGLLTNPLQPSLGLSVLLLLSSFLLLEGFTLAIIVIPFLTTMIVEQLNPITAIFRCKKIFKKQLLKHVFNVLSIAIFFLPIVFLSDYLNMFIYISIILILSYFMILINFVIFDTKERITIYCTNHESKTETDNTFLDNISKFKNKYKK